MLEANRLQLGAEGVTVHDSEFDWALISLRLKI